MINKKIVLSKLLTLVQHLISFFNICRERKQLGGSCFMHVPANVPYVFICESILLLASQFFVYQFVRSFTQVFHCFPFDRII